MTEKGVVVDYKELIKQGPPETYDNTMLSMWCECPRRFFYFMCGLRPKHTALYFVFGRAIGSALKTWHGTEDLEPKERVELGIGEINRVYDAEALNPEDQGDQLNSVENCRTIFIQYAALYPKHEAWKVIAGEVGFEIPVPGTLWKYGGALDGYVEWPGYGILDREDKSTGAWINEPYLNQWKQATQVSGYIWATWQTIGKEPFGCLMNILGKRKRKDPAEQFQRTLERRSEDQIQTFMRDTTFLVDAIRFEWSSRGIFPKFGERNPMNCAGGLGRKACDYRILCIQEAEPWELEGRFNLAEHYKMRKWSPWDRAGKDEE